MPAQLYRRKTQGEPWVLSPPEDYGSFTDQGFYYMMFSTENAAKAAIMQPLRVVTPTEYTKFANDYDRNDDKAWYRFGQAFVNEYLPKGMMDSSLFHATSQAKAEKMIWERYVIID